MIRKLLFSITGSTTIIVFVLMQTFFSTPAISAAKADFIRDFRLMTHRYIQAVANSENTLAISRSHSVLMSCYSFGRGNDSRHPFVELTRIMRSVHKKMRARISYKQFERTLYNGIKFRSHTGVAYCLKKYFGLAPKAPGVKDVKILFSVTGPRQYRIRHISLLRANWSNMSDRLGHREKSLNSQLARADYTIDFEISLELNSPLYRKIKHDHQDIVAIRQVLEKGRALNTRGRVIANYNRKSRNWSYRLPRVEMSNVWIVGRPRSYFPATALIVQDSNQLDTIVKNNMTIVAPDKPNKVPNGAPDRTDRPGNQSAALRTEALSRRQKQENLKAFMRRRAGKTAYPNSVAYRRQYLMGKHLYRNLCQQCHKANGAGNPGIFPDLRQNGFLVGSNENLVRLLLKGKGAMPSFRRLSDRALAAIIVYTRHHWGRAVWPLSTADIRFYRK